MMCCVRLLTEDVFCTRCQSHIRCFRQDVCVCVQVHRVCYDMYVWCNHCLLAALLVLLCERNIK